MAQDTGARLRRLRRRAGLSLRELGERCGIAPSYLSSLEREVSSPTLATLAKIVQALGSDLERFFVGGPVVEQAGPVFRRSEMRQASDAARRYTFLLPVREEMKAEMLDEYLMPGGPAPEFESLKCDIAGVVLSGTLALEVEGAPPAIACPGDAFYVPEGSRHRGYCAGAEPTHLITVCVPPEC